MNEAYYSVRAALIEKIKQHGPTGWYRLEHGLRIPRSEFPHGYNVMTFLNELERDGIIKKDDNGDYIIA